MPPNESILIEKPSMNNGESFKKRLRLNLTVTTIGFVIFVLGIRPDLFQLDRSPVTGFIQITVSILGLGILCLGGYLSMHHLWQGNRLSIAAEIGMRFISTGLVIAIFSALADFFGFGSHPYPQSLPYLGEWQVLGIEIGEYTIAFGFFLMIPFPKIRLFPHLPHLTDTDRR
ncbi:MAG: hypothetical protein C4545_05445 [Anaerolineaceae bacterium]|jgi:hypothetical protein|nr:MAG: hypothetical protein C4545_05445 [Anaerolineaceae bacterium]